MNDGAPILYVSHDYEGDWQFLCGGVHADAAEGALICLEDAVERDRSVNDLATMCTSHVAERESTASPWTIRDTTLENVREVIEEHGWWVGLIDEGDGAPSFAYSIGLYEKLGHPEVIIFGLPLKTMHYILNEVGALVRKGKRFTDGASSNDVLEGYAVRFRAVTARESYARLGYACAFYGDRAFPVLQCVWPDKEHHFPGEANAADFLAAAQPLLS